VPNPIAADRALARGSTAPATSAGQPAGEYEYLGRIDTQVKIRGYASSWARSSS